MQADWQFVKRFLDEDSGMTIEVQRDESVKWPKYSIRVGRMVKVTDPQTDEESGEAFEEDLEEEEEAEYNENGDRIEFRPFIPIFTDRSSVGKVTIRYSLQKLQYMLQEVESFILAKAQEHEYSSIKKMVNQYQGDRPRKPKPNGRTED